MYIRKQYAYVQESRNVLFDYCKTISTEIFIKQNTSFGRGGSIRNLLVHIANTYEFWIAQVALSKEVAFANAEDFRNIQDVMHLFDDVDLFMGEFMDFADVTDQIAFELNSEQRSECYSRQSWKTALSERQQGYGFVLKIDPLAIRARRFIFRISNTHCAKSSACSTFSGLPSVNFSCMLMSVAMVLGVSVVTRISSLRHSAIMDCESDITAALDAA